MTAPLYVSYYTPDYAELAERLRQSCMAAGVEHEISPVPDRGRWDLNCDLKPGFIRDRMEASPGRPVVWVDSDAVIRRRPTLFDRLAAEGRIDVGVCRWKRLRSLRRAEVLSGTIYFGDTAGARQLLETWDRECRENPHRWDQVSLEVSIGQHNLNVEWLPVEYTFISDIHRYEYPEARPVIEHFQNSRIRKAREIADGGMA
jgi:hypothetical protein